jgi:hypothetical protein
VNDLSIAITSFKRPAFLKRSIQSCIAAGITRISVFAMESDWDIYNIVDQFNHNSELELSFESMPFDLGCNELWLQAVYRVATKNVIVLHDDDVLLPEFGVVYRETIAPELSKKAGFASWRGHVLNEKGEVRPVEYFDGATGIYPSTKLAAIVARPGRFSLSPVVSVFDRTVLIAALKEAEQCLTAPESYLHSGMLLGTEILAYLRHCGAFRHWLYVDRVLSHYGSHGGSGTVQAEQSRNTLPLTRGYDIARKHFLDHQNNYPPSNGRLLFVYNDYRPNSGDELRRMARAMETWRFHFDQGTMLEFNSPNRVFDRTSADLDDPRPVPYIRDMIERGMKFAQPEDGVVIANRDICLTTQAADRIKASLAAHGVCLATRRSLVPQHGRQYRSVLNAKPDGGIDLVAFTPEWWQQNGDKLPDFCLGRSCWDEVLSVIAGSGAWLDDVIYHEPHESFWRQNYHTNPAQLHNRRLAGEFYRAHGMNEEARKTDGE